MKKLNKCATVRSFLKSNQKELLSLKHYIWYFSLVAIVVYLSTPLAYISVNILYTNKNLTEEYIPILNGFIHSFMLIGALIFSVGLFNIFRDSNIN